METQSRSSVLQWIAWLATGASAASALASLSIIGQRQRSVILIVMFTVWVLLPYAGLAMGNVRARAWNPAAYRAVQYATILISLAAMARYVYVVVRPLASQPASTFLIVPVVSWIAIGIAVALAKRMRRAT